MDFANLSRLLWRERDLLETLLFKLHQQHLLLVSGDAVWLPRASQEVTTVLELIGEIELERAVEFDVAAHSLGLAFEPGLRTLAAAAPEPWGYLLEEHHTAFMELASRIQRSSHANRELIISAQRATESILTGLDSGPRDTTYAYAATGRPDVSLRRRALVDEEI